MYIKILDASTLGEGVDLKQFESFGAVEIFDTTTAAQTAERVRGAEVLILNKVKITEEVLANADALKLICVAATGYDNIDAAACKARGIAVCNVAGYSTHSVAQVTLSLVLALSIHLKEYNRFVTDGSYTESGVANRLSPVYHELCGKTWGIIGLGNIGKQVARVAEALGCKVLANKRTPEVGYTCVDLDTLLSQSDIITVHTPLTEQTRGLIGIEELAKMKPETILVNAARGAVLDEVAVAEALKNGTLGAFGCDVYSTEPFGKDHPFYAIRNLDNVALTPHMAWGALEARQRCLAEIYKNIAAFLNDEARSRIV